MTADEEWMSELGNCEAELNCFEVNCAVSATIFKQALGNAVNSTYPYILRPCKRRTRQSMNGSTNILRLLEPSSRPINEY
eukprot:COSAG02_NODE_8003_length_2751_cov_7.368778_1_plen_80_part_00